MVLKTNKLPIKTLVSGTNILEMILTILVFLFVSQNSKAHNIREECSDLATDQIYKVGQSWGSLDDCALFDCKQMNLPLGRNELFAVALKADCSEWKSSMISQKHCTLLKPEGGRKEFAQCCQIVVCVEANWLVVYGTDQQGDPKIIDKHVTGENIMELAFVSLEAAKDLQSELTIE